jgi:hypothetical protein
MRLISSGCSKWAFAVLAAGVLIRVASAGTPGKCVGHVPTCTAAAMICGSASTPCQVLVSEHNNYATATAQNLAGGTVGKRNKAICVNPGTTMTWSTQEPDSGFKASFGLVHPFTGSSTTAPVLNGQVGNPVNVTIGTNYGCYQYNLEHSIHGRPKKKDPKVIVTNLRLGDHDSAQGADPAQK